VIHETENGQFNMEQAVMSGLFSKGKIGSLELTNRMIRAASHEGLADERGAPTDNQFQLYKRFIEGGIGLVITGYAGIMQNGKSALYHMTMIDSDDLIPAHKTMVGKVHKIGGKIVLQVAHCGRQTLSKVTGAPPLVAPSPIPCGFYKEMPKELTEPEIFEVIENFALAARRAKDAGYDGVQIHGAHGYLLSTFLSRHSNKRTDRWGGSMENRFRIVGETLRTVREAVGKDYPVLIKLNSYERAKDGIKPLECAYFARLIEKTGCCDAIEISGGTNECGFVMARGAFPTKGILKYLRPYCEMNTLFKFGMRVFVAPIIGLLQPKFTHGYNLDAAAMAKNSVSLPVITVGGMRDRKRMDNAIREGKTDFVSMARPLLLEPDLPNKFKNGQSDVAQCDNCNICVVATDSVPIRCHKNEFKADGGKSLETECKQC
jgi:2,4-dienoyl-CoA reductase-like NADH-dependent reductase (Old Yellow Enzyme family)